MRALDRLALYTTCLAALALGIVAAQIWRPWPGAPDPRREQQLAEPIDLSSLAPELRRAIESARQDGLQHARSELDRLHQTLMTKVDADFLDWYFGYWVQQRLALTYAVNSGKGWVVGTDPEKDLQREIAREFGLRVMPARVLEEHLQDIARRSVKTFVASLQTRLTDIPKRYGIPASQWDSYLQSVSTTVSQTEGSRSVPLTLKGLAGGAALTIVPVLTAQFSETILIGASGVTSAIGRQLGSRALTTLARQIARMNAAVVGGSWSGIGTGVVVLGTLAWEWRDHASTVAENRPRLRDSIDELLNLYEAQLLEPSGMIGSIIHGLERQIASGVAA